MTHQYPHRPQRTSLREIYVERRTAELQKYFSQYKYDFAAARRKAQEEYDHDVLGLGHLSPLPVDWR